MTLTTPKQIPRSVSFAGLRPASETASRAKRANRKKDTAHEVLLRKALWRLGLRYRKHSAGLPGNPDVVFTGSRVVLFCDGDFWHGRHWRRLKKQLQRRHNAAYWVAKITRNMQRDREQKTKLERQGWTVIRLWETDVKRDPVATAQRVREVVDQMRPSPKRD
ncbi:MAG TPA: very short patch repair endonuclease [Gemmataceae bacterium]|nr:very short patch repair endonuclease [Gemmataceae bacterium]